MHRLVSGSVVGAHPSRTRRHYWAPGVPSRCLAPSRPRTCQDCYLWTSGPKFHVFLQSLTDTHKTMVATYAVCRLYPFTPRLPRLSCPRRRREAAPEVLRQLPLPVHERPPPSGSRVLSVQGGTSRAGEWLHVLFCDQRIWLPLTAWEGGIC